MNRTSPLRAIAPFLAVVCLCALTAAALGASPAARPADGLIASPERGWPQWRGPRRDGICDEKGLLQEWPPSGPKLLWKVGGLGRGWSSPIIVGGRLYITGDVDDDLVLFAMDLGGKLLWKATNGKAWHRSFPGARACCAYSEGRLYHLNAHGRVACLDAANGKELWALQILERFGAENVTWAISECLLVDGPRVIVTPGGRKALMAALDKQTGETLWTTEPLGDDRTSYCSPILFRHAGRRLIANASSAHGFGVDADTGKLLWSVPLRNRYDVTVSTPVYSGGCLFYVTANGPNGTLYRLVATRDGIQPEPLWNSPVDTVTGGAVLADGALFASGYHRKVWYRVDWRSGETKNVFNDLTAGAAIYADGRLYCLDESGTVALLRPRPNGPEVAGRFRLVPERAGDAWAHPVLLDGRFYLRYHDTLWCYEVAL